MSIPRSRRLRAAFASASLALASALAGSAQAQSSEPARSSVAAEPARGGAAKPKPLGVGQIAPEFALLDHTGRERALAELLEEVELEQGALLLLFYGRDFAPAATALLRSWKERLAHFEGTPPRVVGISSDDAERNASFHAFLELPFDLLSDPEQRIAKLYGANLPPAAGTNGAAESPPHAAFLVNAKGHVIYLDRDFRATPGDDFRALLRALLLQTPRPANPSSAEQPSPAAQQG